jgi:hypothetical protein
MVLGALIVTGAFTVDRTIPVSALKGSVVEDTTRAMTAIARCFAICIGAPFLCAHDKTRQPSEARQLAPHGKCRFGGSNVWPEGSLR